MRRLKSVDFPTLGRPTTATRARAMAVSLGGDRLRPLLHFDERVHRRRAAADETHTRLPGEPLGSELVGMLDVIRVAALHLREVHELPRVRGVLAADDDDRPHLLGELGGRVLTLHGDRAHGVEDLRLLGDLRDVRDEVLERPRRLRRLRDDARLLHPRELLPLVLRFDDDRNNTATAYTGTVHISSSDAAAVTPANNTLTNGVGTFV